MAAIANQSEYLEIDGIPLSTAAWHVEDLSAMWDTAPYIGDDLTVPYRRGVVGFRRAWGGKVVDLPFAVFGDFKSDGTPVAAANIREQLWLNRNELLRDVLRPIRVNTQTGARLIRYVGLGSTLYSGPGQIIGQISPQKVGPSAFRGSLTLMLNDGGLRSETQVDLTSASVAGGGLLDFAVTNPGTDTQDRMLVDLTGTATSVKLTNLTADVGASIFLEFGGSLDAGVLIDTGSFTAVRASISVIGLINARGFERWLPLVPGSNTIRIEPQGGTCTARFRHYPFYG